MDRLKKHKLLRSIRFHQGCCGYIHRDGPVRKVRNPSRIAARAIVGGSDNGERSNEILKNSGREILVQCETLARIGKVFLPLSSTVCSLGQLYFCVYVRVCVYMSRLTTAPLVPSTYPLASPPTFLDPLEDLQLRFPPFRYFAEWS